MKQGTVVLLDGPIGVGKTTLGRLMAQRFGGAFIDGDDHKTPGRPWYCSSLTTCQSILSAALSDMQTTPIVFIARPVRRREWIFFTQRFRAAGVELITVGFSASIDAIIDSGRGRSFSETDKARIEVMLREGYGTRPFSDAFIRTDEGGLNETADLVAATVNKLCQR